MSAPTYNILCLDGGGIRGLITAILLTELEERMNRPLHEVFDLIAGTSTGSILACGLATGRPASAIADLYRQRGREVFPARPRLLFNRVTRLMRPKYGAEGLERALQDELGAHTAFGDGKVDTLVVAYNTRGREPAVFKSWRSNHKDIPAWQVCRASCAAPAYFPGIELAIEGNEPPETPLIDGGVVANNPSACALAEGRQIMRDRPEPDRIPLERFVMASFGAGSNAPPYGLADIGRWGLLPVIRPLLNILMDGSVVATNYIVSRVLEKGSLFRFPIELEAALVRLDDASPENLAALERVAQAYFLDGERQRELDRLAQMLAASRP